MIRAMSLRDFASIDRDLDALDPELRLAARGREASIRGVASRLVEVDAWLTELGGPIESTSGVSMRAAPRDEPDADVDVMTTLAPPPPATTIRPTIDHGVDPELSFDDLFDDSPIPEPASEPLATLAPTTPPAPHREHESLERATLELDDDELAALDSLEIILDD